MTAGVTEIGSGGVDRRTAILLNVHAVLFGSIALACYAAPQVVLGGGAWLQLPRLAVLLFAATLVAITSVLIGSARSSTPRQAGLALLAALALDVQIPILILSQPASVEHFQTNLGLPWFLIPLVFVVMVGVTVHCFLRRRRAVLSA